MFGYILIKRKRLRQIIKKIAEYELQRGYEEGKKQAFDSIGLIYKGLGLRCKPKYMDPIAKSELPTPKEAIDMWEEILKEGEK